MVIKNIIFSGGGFKGWAYIGSIRALNEVLPFKDIKQVIGVSVGAIFGVFYLLKLDHTYLLNYLLNIDIKKYYDIDLDSFLTNQSILRGKKIKHIILTVMKQDFTFQELYNKTGIKFTTCAFNITSCKLDYFDYISNPDLKVADAIMASCALPVLFPAYKIGDNFYYDGGMCNNCPCNLVDPKTSIAFNVTGDFSPSRYKILELLMSLTRHLNNLNITNNQIIYNISSRKYDDEMFNVNQSNDILFNIYMDGYINTKKILYFFLKNCERTVFLTGNSSS